MHLHALPPHHAENARVGIQDGGQREVLGDQAADGDVAELSGPARQQVRAQGMAGVGRGPPPPDQRSHAGEERVAPGQGDEDPRAPHVQLLLAVDDDEVAVQADGQKHADVERHQDLVQESHRGAEPSAPAPVVCGGGEEEESSESRGHDEGGKQEVGQGQLRHKEVDGWAHGGLPVHQHAHHAVAQNPDHHHHSQHHGQDHPRCQGQGGSRRRRRTIISIIKVVSGDVAEDDGQTDLVKNKVLRGGCKVHLAEIDAPRGAGHSTHSEEWWCLNACGGVFEVTALRLEQQHCWSGIVMATRPVLRTVILSCWDLDELNAASVQNRQHTLFFKMESWTPSALYTMRTGSDTITVGSWTLLTLHTP